MSPKTLLHRLAAPTAAGLVLAGLALPPAAGAGPVTLRPVGQTARFDHFDVRVVRTAIRPGVGFVATVRVCVTGRSAPGQGRTVRVSRDPWTVTDATGRTHRPSRDPGRLTDGFPVPGRTETRVRAGGCVRGAVPFASIRSWNQVGRIDYRNSLGDRARWEGFPVRDLGRRVDLGRFTVRVHEVRRTTGEAGPWYGVRATTCVASRAYGGRSSRISWAPWAVYTSHERVPLRITQEGGSPWEDVYPVETRLDPGECVTGWLPFGAADLGEVVAVEYRNAVGDQARWRVG